MGRKIDVGEQEVYSFASGVVTLRDRGNGVWQRTSKVCWRSVLSTIIAENAPGWLVICGSVSLHLPAVVFDLKLLHVAGPLGNIALFADCPENSRLVAVSCTLMPKMFWMSCLHIRGGQPMPPFPLLGRTGVTTPPPTPNIKHCRPCQP